MKKCIVLIKAIGSSDAFWGVFSVGCHEEIWTRGKI